MKSLIFVLLFIISNLSYSKVINQSEHAFELSTRIIINQPVATVFKQFGQVELWWHPDHTFSGKAENMVLAIDDACFCERWSNNIIRHMNIVAVEENKRQVWHGGLGPLQSFAVNGALTWDFKAITPQQTSVTYTYRVYGAIPDTAAWSGAVDSVLIQQLSRLKKSIK